ncbi:MAG: hypothetical protein A3K09_01245 [Nitrospinae bacterium RIFCSPLOWO2_12_FULL_47_7]|nr:MAG: hypothetical protein A3K09_01245 [Nitrospinae bacterium RIFCSPLOWO2_12_FULL_47_7]
MTNQKEQRIVVRIDPDLEELIPQYLKNRQGDIQKMLSALEINDYSAIGVIGHTMKGSGGGYGFHPISRIGGEIELSADAKSADQIRELAEQLADYLNRIEIIYV